MITFNSKDTQLDSILDQMAKDVQLDKTRYTKMVQGYEAVQKWIEADETFFKPYKYEVYPHGSVRILTTVKPIGKDEFDLDLVLHFKDSTIQHSPNRIYTELKRRLNEHEKYRKILIVKSRVIRLDYAGDFHMDIMPSIQETKFDQDKIIVPDRELGQWVSSNPRGFAKWFMDKANLVESSLLEKALRAEKIQSDDFDNKKPLQRAVQLLKRYRDIFFKDDGEYKPQSIILTTIAGEYYSGEESIFLTVDGIISKIRSNFHFPQRIKVLNPVNPEEDFTDKWEEDPKYYEAFKKFIKHLYQEWQQLKEQNGLAKEADIFKNLFGEKLYERAQLKEIETLSNFRKANILGITNGTGTLSKNSEKPITNIKKNTFYGE